LRLSTVAIFSIKEDVSLDVTYINDFAFEIISEGDSVTFPRP